MATLRIIVGVFALVCVPACGLLATFATFEIARKVNDKVSEAEKFGFLGWHPFNAQRLYSEYRIFYPNGSLLLRVRVLTVLMLVCLLLAAWGLAVFSK